MSELLHKDLLTALKEPGCPVCRLENAAVDRYLQTVLGESSHDLSIRHERKDSLGFCREHTWRLKTLGIGNTPATTLGYHDVLLAAAQALQNADHKSHVPKRRLFLRKRDQTPMRYAAIVKALTPVKGCPACRLAARYSRVVLQELTGPLLESGISGNLKASDGLCLHHLRQAFEVVEDVDNCKMLIVIHLDHYETRRRELVEVIRELEQREEHQVSRKIDTTWRKVISAVNGDR